MPSRRTVLATLGTAVGAGCTSLPGSGGPGSAVFGGGPAITGIRVQRSYVGLKGPHHKYVRAEPGSQYVLVETDAESGTELAASVTLDGETYDRAGPRKTAAELGDDHAIPVVSLPLDLSLGGEAPAAGSVTVGGTTRELDAETIDSLANPPRFELTAFEVPEHVEPNGEFRVRVTVAHRGGRAERFRANLVNCMSWQPHILRIDPASQDDGRAMAAERVRTCDETEYAVELSWGYGSIRRDVAVGEADGSGADGGSDEAGNGRDAATTTGEPPPTT